jgi:hypothetical protein
MTDVPPAPAPAPATPEPAQPKVRSAGRTPLVLGIIALVLAFIPYVCWVGFVLAIIGTVIGVRGIVAKKKVLPGTIVSIIALILSLVMGIVYSHSPAAAPASSTTGSGTSSGTKAAPKPAPKVDWYATTYGSFTPVKASGAGDDVITLPAGAKAGIIVATYSGSDNFSIQGLDKTNQPTTDLAVNTIGAYSGTTAFGLETLGGSSDATLQVTADAAWTITISPISTAAALPASGTGDGVFKYDGAAKTWAITGSGTGNFSVQQYSASPLPNLAVNEIGAYSGKVPADAGPSIVVIGADGAWTIQ